MQDIYDVIVVGDGLVGASIIRALQHPKLQLLWIKPNKKNIVQSGQDRQRPIALAKGSADILASYGVWQYLQGKFVPIEEVRVSEHKCFGITRLRARDHQLDALGYIVSAQVLQEALNKAVAEFSSITEIYATAVSSINRLSGKIEVSVQTDQGEQVIATKLIIAADGSFSGIRGLESINVLVKPSVQTAVTAQIKLLKSHNNIAHERFTKTGTIGVLPLADQQYGIVWAVHNEFLPAIMEQQDSDFIQLLNYYLGYSVGKITAVSERKGVPLRIVYAQEQIRPRLVLLGNAAHNLHPAVGQGFNLGLRDLALLAKLIIANIEKDGDPGAWGLLENYYKNRHLDQTITTGFTDFIVKVFSYNFLPMLVARDLGLITLDIFPWLKSKLTQQAMGL